MSERLLVLFDGNAIVHRAYHALQNAKPLTVSKTGEIVSAVYGFANILLKTVNDVKPTHWAIAFDMAAPTFRHDMYVEYKAHRPKTPDELVNQFGRVKELVAAFNIPIFEKEGFEADDVIGTLSRQAAEQDTDVVIVTGDADSMQLVNPRVKVLYPKRGGSVSDTMLYDEAAVLERYGVKPENIADYKALVGDPSDNIPGVKGIGEKTAVKLIQTFGPIEEIYTHLTQVTPPRVQALLQNDEAAGRQSKVLATIVTDAPLKLDLDACSTTTLERQRVTDIFRELEFYSLLKRIPGAEGNRNSKLRTQNSELGRRGVGIIAEAKKAEDITHNYRTITTREELDDLIRRINKAKSFVIDVVTDGEEAMSAQIVGVAVGMGEGEAYYVPVGTTDNLKVLSKKLDATETANNLQVTSSRFLNVADSKLHTAFRGEKGLNMQDDAEASQKLEPTSGQLGMSFDELGTSGPVVDPMLNKLKTVLENEAIAKMGHDTKFDMIVLAENGITVKNMTFDTMVAAYLLNEKALSLKPLVFNRLEVEMTQLTDLTGTGSKQIKLSDVGVEQVCEYACADADMTMRLAGSLAPELDKQGVQKLFADVEMPLIPVLVHMERSGVLIDVDLLNKMSIDLGTRINALEKQIFFIVGHEFNISSPQQLSAVLFQDLHLTAGKKLKGGGFSTGADVLEELKGTHAIVDLVLEYRTLTKLKSTYVDALPCLINKKTGRVHTSFNQTKTTTGRLSSTEPNLQNIPVRGDLGKQIRHAFIVPPGTTLLAGDYSQIDLRALAHLSQDPNLLAAFNRDEDIHSATAAQIYGVSASEVTPDMRRLAKTVNFGVIYGMSSYGLEQATDLSREEAQKFIRAYFEKYEGVKDYLEKTKQFARDNGYVQTLLGRRRNIPEINASNRIVREAAERMAINMPVQGTSADIIKVAMINMYQIMNKPEVLISKSETSTNPSTLLRTGIEIRNQTYNQGITNNQETTLPGNNQETSNKIQTNTNFQNSITKLGLTRPLKSKMLLQVHDELLFEVPDEELELMVHLVPTIMNSAVKLSVPLKVDIKKGKSWGQLE